MDKRHRILTLFVIFFLAVSVSYCLEPLPGINPFILSTCGLSAMTDDPSITLINPAAGKSGVSSSTSFLQGMTELNQYEVSSILEYKESGIFIGWQTLNNDDYDKQDYRFGYRFGYKTLYLGLGYKLSYDKIPGYGSEKDESMYTGFRLKLSNTTIDFATSPIKVSSLPENTEKRTVDFSLNQDFSKEAALAFGVTSTRDKPNNYKVGCRVETGKYMQSYVSWESEPGRFGIGSEFNLEWLKLIYSIQTHPELKWTHAVGISLMFP